MRIQTLALARVGSCVRDGRVDTRATLVQGRDDVGALADVFGGTTEREH